MRYRRALMLLPLASDPQTALAVLRCAAPALEELLMLVAPEPSPARLFAKDTPPAAAHEARLAQLREAAAHVAQRVEAELSPPPPAAALAALCAERGSELIVLPPSLRAASSLFLQRPRPPVDVLWARGPVAAPIHKLGCVALDQRSLRAIGAFLRDRAQAADSVALLSSWPVGRDALSAGLELSGVHAQVQVSSPRDAADLLDWLERWARGRALDLLVFARAPSALVLGSVGSWSELPVLLLPPLPAAAPVRRALDVADVLELGGALRARADQVSALGGIEPLPDQRLALVSGGVVLGEVTTRAGELQLPAAAGVVRVGLYRRHEGEGERVDPLLAIEEQVNVLRATQLPLCLYDAALGSAALRALRERRQDLELVAVRLRPERSCRVIRRRLRAAGLPPYVVDARALLDEGDALDVSEQLDALRLARLAARAERAGYKLAAIVYRGPRAPGALPQPALSEHELRAGLPWPEPQPATARPTPLREGNAIELELDNTCARRWLLDAIAGSQHSLHLQVYMALDDEVGGAVCTALAAAGARGVRVRVLVDSLHGLHGSFGAHNPLLARLSSAPGVAVRTVRPITELPSLADLKQRDHRKLVIADGALALVGGRNLSHEYYTGFDEVPLTAASDWRSLPWLDAGARVAGPVVADLQRAFRDAWQQAGGRSFAIQEPAAAAATRARAVVHLGLRDAHALETYLELFASARSHIYVVNGFPLALELQHALLCAARRGVQVRVLLGHVTPTHGSQPFAGSWSTARTAATELVHSRIDPLVAAGAQAYLFALRDVPGWSEALGVVYPHVHAKLVSVDGERCSVGSANLDITSAYWESELLLLIEDAPLARSLEARIAQLMAASTRIRADDPAWQEQARRRAWMRHWPGVLSV